VSFAVCERGEATPLFPLPAPPPLPHPRSLFLSMPQRSANQGKLLISRDSLAGTVPRHGGWARHNFPGIQPRMREAATEIMHKKKAGNKVASN
jgi:hypothetical protein